MLILNLQTKAQTKDGDEITSYFKQNVAIVDARVRSVDREFYIKELLLLDFKKTAALIENFEFSGIVFTDNGQGYDKIAGDGIYTSAGKYPHSAKVPYRDDPATRSVLENPLVDADFVYEEELNDYLSATGKIKVTIDCDVYVCSCEKCSCKTCWVAIVGPAGGVIGIVKHCLKVMNCHVEISWE